MRHLTKTRDPGEKQWNWRCLGALLGALVLCTSLGCDKKSASSSDDGAEDEGAAKKTKKKKKKKDKAESDEAKGDETAKDDSKPKDQPVVVDEFRDVMTKLYATKSEEEGKKLLDTYKGSRTYTGILDFLLPRDGEPGYFSLSITLPLPEGDPMHGCRIGCKVYLPKADDLQWDTGDKMRVTGTVNLGYMYEGKEWTISLEDGCTATNLSGGGN